MHGKVCDGITRVPGTSSTLVGGYKRKPVNYATVGWFGLDDPMACVQWVSLSSTAVVELRERLSSCCIIS